MTSPRFPRGCLWCVIGLRDRARKLTTRGRRDEVCDSHDYKTTISGAIDPAKTFPVPFVDLARRQFIVPIRIDHLRTDDHPSDVSTARKFCTTSYDRFLDPRKEYLLIFYI